MTRFLLITVAALGLLFAAALWRLDHVTSERDTAIDLAKQGAAAVASLRGTIALQRDLASDQAAIETTYLEEKQRAEDYAESLRPLRCESSDKGWISSFSSGCKSWGSCIRAAGGGGGSVHSHAGGGDAQPASAISKAAAQAFGQPDAGRPELTAAARRAYPALVAGLATQRAQIAGLQAELTTLHSKCKIGATP